MSQPAIKATMNRAVYLWSRNYFTHQRMSNLTMFLQGMEASNRQTEPYGY